MYQIFFFVSYHITTFPEDGTQLQFYIAWLWKLVRCWVRIFCIVANHAAEKEKSEF